MWDWLDEVIGLIGDSGDVSALADLSDATALADVGDFLPEVADVGGDATEWFDTATGEMVTAAEAQSLADLDMSGSGSGPLGSDFTGSLDTSPVSTSTSDMLRSLQADPAAPGSESFDWNAMADPSASIASAGGGTNWSKLLAQGLQAGLGALGSGAGALAGAGGSARGAADMPGLPPMMNAADARVIAPGAADIARAGAFGTELPGAPAPATGGVDYARLSALGGGSDLAAPRLGTMGSLGMQDAVSALLSRLQADPGARAGLQAPIDAGPPPRPFTPLAIPQAGPGSGSMAQMSSPRMSGLQRLLLERMG